MFVWKSGQNSQSEPINTNVSDSASTYQTPNPYSQQNGFQTPNINPWNTYSTPTNTQQSNPYAWQPDTYSSYQNQERTGNAYRSSQRLQNYGYGTSRVNSNSFGRTGAVNSVALRDRTDNILNRRISEANSYQSDVSSSSVQSRPLQILNERTRQEREYEARLRQDIGLLATVYNSIGIRSETLRNGLPNLIYHLLRPTINAQGGISGGHVYPPDGVKPFDIKYKPLVYPINRTHKCEITKGGISNEKTMFSSEKDIDQVIFTIDEARQNSIISNYDADGAIRRIGKSRDGTWVVFYERNNVVTTSFPIEEEQALREVKKTVEAELIRKVHNKS